MLCCKLLCSQEADFFSSYFTVFQDFVKLSEISWAFTTQRRAWWRIYCSKEEVEVPVRLQFRTESHKYLLVVPAFMNISEGLGIKEPRVGLLPRLLCWGLVRPGIRSLSPPHVD